MTNKCNNCIHSNVCIYKQKYQEKYYMILENELKQDEPFSIELNCKEYNSNESISYNDLKINYSSINSSLSVNPCEGCNIFEDMKKGKMVVNDACNFCSKNPLKVGD